MREGEKKIADLKLKKINLLLKNYKAFRELDANGENDDDDNEEEAGKGEKVALQNCKRGNGKAI